MKNKSWQYPFPTFCDKFFDSNKDGKLDTLETFFRDMHLNEIKQNADNNLKSKSTKSQYIIQNKVAHTTNTDANRKPEKKVSYGIQLFVIILVMIISVVGFMVTLSLEKSMQFQVVTILIAVKLCISLLRSVGLHR